MLVPSSLWYMTPIWPFGSKNSPERYQPSRFSYAYTWMLPVPTNMSMTW